MNRRVLKNEFNDLVELFIVDYLKYRNSDTYQADCLKHYFWKFYRRISASDICRSSYSNDDFDMCFIRELFYFTMQLCKKYDYKPYLSDSDLKLFTRPTFYDISSSL